MFFINAISKFLFKKSTINDTNDALKNWEAAGRPVPPPHRIKQLTIEEHQRQSGYQLLVETGTYLGEMVEAEKSNFNRVYSIELSEHLFLAAKKKFQLDINVTIIQGDSGDVLPNLMREINEPAIFWLDGHYSEGFTAKGRKDCPIFEELAAIFNAKSFKHILLIDDARLFTGDNDYPNQDELIAFIKRHRPSMESFIKNDIMHIFL